MTVKIINSPEIKSLGVYNQAIQVTGGSLLFVSGCVFRGRRGKPGG